VTAGNASTLSDGGAACVLMTEAEANARGLKPLARIVDYADGATDPIDFPLAPRFANDKLLKQVGMNAQDVDLWEINEAFSVVVLANMKLHELDPGTCAIMWSPTKIVMLRSRILKNGKAV
jgi:acetyl-CoA C-acetyltransferase